MNILIIYAHPNPESFNHAILEKVISALKEGCHSFEVIDLYEDNFNPVLVFNNENKRKDLLNDPETEIYRTLIKQADHLIFIYPIWWYGAPAILKGFIDRVFVSGFAYAYEGYVPKGLLRGKSAWVIYTLDSPSWYARLFRRNIEWKIMKHAILKYCGIHPVTRMMFAGVKNSNLKNREKWLDHLYTNILTKLK